MSDIKLNAAHDIDDTDGSPSMVEGADAIAQHVDISLQFMLGEWVFDTKQGIPYFGRILIRGFNEADIREIIRSDIQAIPGILTVEEVVLDFDAEARTMSISGQATSIDGPIDFSVQV